MPAEKYCIKALSEEICFTCIQPNDYHHSIIITLVCSG